MWATERHSSWRHLASRTQTSLRGAINCHGFQYKEKPWTRNSQSLELCLGLCNQCHLETLLLQKDRDMSNFNTQNDDCGWKSKLDRYNLSQNDLQISEIRSLIIPLKLTNRHLFGFFHNIQQQTSRYQEIILQQWAEELNCYTTKYSLNSIRQNAFVVDSKTV